MHLKDSFLESAKIKTNFIETHELQLQIICNVIIECIKNNWKILLSGNGWSAADAQHRAAELVGRYKTERQSLSAIALTTDTSILTAIGNDYGFDKIFSRQIQWLGKKWDIFIGISTSGNSQNIIDAITECKKQWIITVALLGRGGGKINSIVDYSLIVPSDNTPRIQECHMTIYHTICEMLDEKFTLHDSKR